MRLVYFILFELVSYIYIQKKNANNFLAKFRENNNLDLFVKYLGSITNYLPVS